MSWCHRMLFIMGFSLKRPKMLQHYTRFQKTQWKSIEWLTRYQEDQLRQLVIYAYENVPYYRQTFDRLDICPTDIRTLQDLEHLPVLTKKTIKANWTEFFPKRKVKYVHGATGGSTGDPLKYRMSLEDYERGNAILYRSLGYAGYELGDRMAVMAGSSLIPSMKTDLLKKVVDFFLNFRRYSSFEMSEKNLALYYRALNGWQPSFIRGYPTSIYQFARFIKENDLRLDFQPKAVFTTAEKLLDNQRLFIEEVFRTRVFDTYGLHDGGISAFECDAHMGMHISMERSVFEVVDDENRQIVDRKGKILATSLFNYALPFFRYDTGDLGIVSSRACSCGRAMPLLREIYGRETDFLKLNGIIIGSPVLTVLMGSRDIVQHQIIQTGPASIICRIIRGAGFGQKDEDFITQSFYTHIGRIKIDFEYTEHIHPDKTGAKHKFIINRTNPT
ncbi:MAG: phenylacetate--CoA ligase family protein [Deltaproteobacteria bacterium]|nr:phenylacetate--CoA ligase family protein [Deltaproteobacteria bacterium]